MEVKDYLPTLYTRRISGLLFTFRLHFLYGILAIAYDENIKHGERYACPSCSDFVVGDIVFCI